MQMMISGENEGENEEGAGAPPGSPLAASGLVHPPAGVANGCSRGCSGSWRGHNCYLQHNHAANFFAGGTGASPLMM